MEKFDTGATRNLDVDRIDPEGFLSYRPLEAYFNYMHKNRFQSDGTMRDSDNWQKGIPQYRYAKSLWRHFFDFWKTHRMVGSNKIEPSPYRNEQIITDCCGMLFNVMGYLDQELQKPEKLIASRGLLRVVPETVQEHPLRSKFLDDQDPGDEDNKNDWGV